MFLNKHVSFICGALDILLILLLFIPVFGNGPDSTEAVSLFDMANIALWIQTVFAVLIIVTVLNGICGVVISFLGRPVWMRHRIVTGMALSVISSVMFIAARQPYAGIICFIPLVIKGMLLIRTKW